MESLKRLIQRLFPELVAGYHKPQLGRVLAINDAPKTGGRSTLERPRFAVDIQPLNEHLEDHGPILRDIQVAIPYAGALRGFYALPDPGSIVEYCFDYALPHLLHIRATLPLGLELPQVDAGEAIWQHSATVKQGYDAAGNWHRATDQNMTDACDQIRSCQAGVKQLLKSPKTWVGSDSENVLKILSDFMQSTSDALNTLASHTHATSPPPNQSGDIAGFSSSIASDKSGRLDPITE